jgi:hypothetical protein
LPMRRDVRPASRRIGNIIMPGTSLRVVLLTPP